MNSGYINWDEKLLPYSQAVDELTVKFKSMASGFNTLGIASPIQGVEGRVKSVSSILGKLNRKNIPIEEFEEKLEDIAGIRIICRFVEDIERIIELIRERDGLDMEVLKERDYVTNRKDSGYRSFHLIIRYPVVTAIGKKYVFCEIQVRTMVMDFWAVIEHSLRYKYDKMIPDEIRERLVKSADAALQLDNELSKIRAEIVSVERSNFQKTVVVDEIIENIQVLYKYADYGEAENFNQQLLIINDSGDEDALFEFSRQVKVLAELYRPTNKPSSSRS